jgi:sucrose-6-phosphate hydrolase SacC (GH32 family)
MSETYSRRHVDEYQQHLSEMLNDPQCYSEPHRPRIHFTPAFNWCNDPNGLVYYDGEYHLFFQHNPVGCEWGNNSWGHAVSPDLLHWKQLPIALWPDEHGTIWSGSVIIDNHNTAGFQTNDECPMIATYTSAGDYGRMGEPFDQRLAFSNDRGRTWIKYAKNPVLPNQSGGNDRDPKIFWCNLTNEWVMVLYLDQGKRFGFFTSPDLLTWRNTGEVSGFYECPDLFELPVDGNRDNTRWVLMDASGTYLIGTFDGRTFSAESGKHRSDYGANFYAPHTFYNVPEADGRRIQMAWMDGGTYPGMPFNQQLSFPCELRLQTFSEGIRLCRQPVKEIEYLCINTASIQDRDLIPGGNPLDDIDYDLFDLQLILEPLHAGELGLRIGSLILHYDVHQKVLVCGPASASIDLEAGKLNLRVLVDRTSIEVFGNSGQVTLTSCYLRDQSGHPDLELYVQGGSAYLDTLEIHELKSIWEYDSPTDHDSIHQANT